MGFFSKLSNKTSNFFKKSGNDIDNIFKKSSGDIVNLANKTANGLDIAGNKIAGGLKQTGNFLEKNSGAVSDAAATLAIASGVGAELAPGIIAAGNTGQAFGSKLKKSAGQVQNMSQMGQQTVQNKGGAFAGVLNDANNSIQSANRSVVNRFAAAAQPTNQLAQIHADLVT